MGVIKHITQEVDPPLVNRENLIIPFDFKFQGNKISPDVMQKVVQGFLVVG